MTTDIAKGLDAIDVLHTFALRSYPEGTSQHNAEMDTHMRTAADALIAAKARIAELEKENFALAAWQCVYTDGKTGIVNTEHGHQVCAMTDRATKAEAQLAECAYYLKEGQTPKQRMDQDQSDILGLMELLRLEKVKNEDLKAQLARAVECLRPFAIFGDELSIRAAKGRTIPQSGPIYSLGSFPDEDPINITVEDFASAREAISKAKGDA